MVRVAIDTQRRRGDCQIVNTNTDIRMDEQSNSRGCFATKNEPEYFLFLAIAVIFLYWKACRACS